MAKSMCGKCGVRFAQHFDPPRCRGCLTGIVLPTHRENEDDSPAVIERKYQRALADIRARNRPEPSREYRG